MRPFRVRTRLAALSAAGLVAGLVAIAPPATAAAPTVTVVRSGLDNPRDVTWWKGHLYVAEAGHGGTECPAGLMGPDGAPLCFGFTSQVSDITGGGHTAVIDNLLSF